MKKLFLILLVAGFIDLSGCSLSTEPVVDVNGKEARSIFVNRLPKGYTNLRLIDTQWGYFDFEDNTYLMYVSFGI